MSTSPAPYAPGPDQTRLIFRNVSLSYVVTGTELLLGVFMLPFNVAHLGQSAYGLWVLVASITMYFSMFDLGYGLAQVRFTAKYRAEGKTDALNEMASTMFFVFSLIGLLAFSIAVLISGILDQIFSLDQAQERTARLVLLVISSYVALSFPASVFGGIVNGFQRTYLNGAVAFITAITVAAVNVIVLLSGYGLSELVIATTSVRILSLFAYALNAYKVFPALRIRWQSFSKQRLREATGFSVYAMLIDIANKLNYSSDTLVIGAFLGTASVAVWAVAQRLIEIVQRITDQLNGALFPVVVDSATFQDQDRLQKVLLQGTRLSLASVVVVATSLSLLARPLVFVWVGPDFLGSIPIIYILTIAVSVRVGNATSSMILKGSGEHRVVAMANSAMAVANISLSIVLVHFYGLIGVALGTLTPMVLVSLAIVFPAACRRVQISKLKVIRYAIWPALWPAIPMTLVLLVTGDVNSGWAGLLTRAGLGATTYVLFFLTIAISKDERAWYFGKVRHILGLT